MAKLMCPLSVAAVGFKFWTGGLWVYKKSGKSSYVSGACLSSNFEGTWLSESLHYINKNKSEILTKISLRFIDEVPYIFIKNNMYFVSFE